MATVSNTGKAQHFGCPACGKSFVDRVTLDAHKKLDHSGEAEPPTGVG